MYPRFYREHHRLVVNLVTSRRVGRQARMEHIGRLGSVVLTKSITAEERLRFWRELPGRFAALDVKFPGRVTLDDKRKILAGIAARIPKPTETEERQAEISAAVAKARLMPEKRRKRPADAPRRQPSRAAS
jgi:hypothetical protein